MATSKNRNGKIDFLKLVFSTIIVLYHAKYVVGNDNCLFLGGSFSVEFFFMVSGYLMMASIRRLSAPPVCLGVETKDFLLRKLKSFCPELIIAYIIGFAVVGFAQNIRFLDLLSTSFSELLLVNMFGLWITKINTVVWYLSSMLLAMAILYPLLRKFRTAALYVVIPLLSLFLLGWFCGNGDDPRNATEWVGLTYRGNLRALAELGIGVCLYPIVEKVRTLHFTVFARCLLTAVEYTLYGLIIYYMHTAYATQLDYFYLLLFAVALIISLSGVGIDAPLFANRFGWLGKFSVSLFLSHYFYSQTIPILFPNDTIQHQAAIYYACSGVTTLVVMLLSELIRKQGSKLTLKRLFVRPEIAE